LSGFDFKSLVPTVATGNVNDEQLAKPGCNEPKEEEAVEYIIFPRYYARRQGQEVKHKVDLATTGGLYSTGGKLELRGTAREQDRNQENVPERTRQR
jgi:hypothetical protein